MSLFCFHHDDIDSLAAKQQQEQLQEQQQEQQQKQQDVKLDPEEASQQVGRMVEILALNEEPQHQAAAATQKQLSFGDWMEAKELRLALAIAESEAANSSSSSSSSINISSKRMQKIQNIHRGAKHQSSLETIQEANISTMEYVTASGCRVTAFTSADDSQAGSPAKVCPYHAQFQPHCSNCANYQFLVQKHQHELHEARAIEASLDQSSITYSASGRPRCSKHFEDMQEWCTTCQRVVALLDQFAD